VAIDIKPDLDTAVKFLQSWCSEPVLSAKMVDESTGQKGDFETQQFRHPCDWDAVRKWIADRQRPGNWGNIYFAVNPPKGAVDKKTGRGDLGYMVACHCDIDVRPGEDQLLGTERILKLLTHCKNPPSVIISSGGGAQPIWRLAAPVPIDGNIAIAENLKLYNVAIERDLGGDHCHDLTRILRVPGTVNVPDAEKMKRGRVPRLATLYKCDPSISYSLDQFPKAEPEAPPTEEGFVAKKASDYGAVDPKDGRLVKLSKEWLDLGLLGDTKNEYRDAGGKTDRSRMALAFATACLRAQVDKETLASIIMDKGWKVGECVRDKGGETRRQLKRLIERAQKFVEDDLSKPPVLGKDTWMKTAGIFINRCFPDGLVHWRDEFHAYAQGVYLTKEDDSMRSLMRKFLANAVMVKRKAAKTTKAQKDANDKAATIGGGEPAPEPEAEGEDAIAFVPFNPSHNDVSELLSAVKDTCHVDSKVMEQPCWLNEADDRPPPQELINCRNGLLHVPTRTLLEHSPDFFSGNRIAFDYDAKADCPMWKKTLGEYWQEQDALEPQTLQEMMGYSLVPWTSLQKLFALIGPGRSGKGTIGRVLTMLVGDENTAAPSLGNVGTNSGQQSLIGKTIALIGEAGFGSKDDRAAVTNFLKTVSGEDKVSIPRKYHTDWVGRLLIRFWLNCNKIPNFDDSGKALMMRLIPLRMTRSFTGIEDEDLEDKLSAEIAGILNWCLTGYDRLVSNKGKFTMPQSSRDLIEVFGRLASPLLAFIEEWAELDPKSWVLESDLHAAYEEWCDKVHMKPKSQGTFIEELVSLDPAKFKRERPRTDANGVEFKTRPRVIAGLKLSKTPEPKERKRNDRKRDADQDKIPF
jgi:P4 family phage/plasmid primase-like protien